MGTFLEDLGTNFGCRSEQLAITVTVHSTPVRILCTVTVTGGEYSRREGDDDQPGHADGACGGRGRDCGGCGVS